MKFRYPISKLNRIICEDIYSEISDPSAAKALKIVFHDQWNDLSFVEANSNDWRKYTWPLRPLREWYRFDVASYHTDVTWPPVFDVFGVSWIARNKVGDGI